MRTTTGLARGPLGLGLLLLSSVGCGDDDMPADASSGAGTTSDSTSSDASGSTTSATTTDPGTTTSGSTGDTDEGTGSSSGGLVGDVVLRNDGWEDPAAVAFQEGFAQGECWASVYVPAQEHYPFVVDGVSMFVGGEDMGSAMFGVELWEVDADTNMPTTMVASGTTTFSGANEGFDGITMQALGIDSPIYASGNFAVAVCLLAHEGFPAVARDADGTIAQDLNWIRIEDGSWIQSATPGVTGDWIMRATIVVQ
jgi:hypothetical protein